MAVGTQLTEVAPGFLLADSAEKERGGHLFLLSSSTAHAPPPTHPCHHYPEERSNTRCGNPSQLSGCPLWARQWAWFPYQSKVQKARAELPGGIGLGAASQSFLEHSSCLFKTLLSQSN